MKKDAKFYWGQTDDTCLNELKRMVTNTSVLAYYDPKVDVTIQCDSLSKGLDSTIMQRGKPLEFASCALTKNQENFSQLEKVCLSKVFCCKQFHHYLYGQDKIMCENDHKPLQSIFRKSIHEIPARLQKMRFELTRYNLEVIYTPGKYLYLADV